MKNRKNKIQLVLRLVEDIFSRQQSQTANVHFVKITDLSGESMSMFPKRSLPSETILRILHLPEYRFIFVKMNVTIPSNTIDGSLLWSTVFTRISAAPE